jgi:hypothetical protein
LNLYIIFPLTKIMIKSLFFIASFCAIIFFNTFSASAAIRSDHFKSTLSLTAPALLKDTTKKSKITILVNKIVKPLKFTSNERARVKKIIHDYLTKDSIAWTTDIKTLKAQLPALNGQLNKLKEKLDSISNLPSPSKIIIPAKNPILPPNGNTVKPTDTVAKAVEVKPIPDYSGPNHLMPITDIKAEQQKIKLVRRLYKAPFFDTIYSKDRDSTIIRRIGITHKMQVFGFYADTAHSVISDIDFKLITSFVYALNVDKSSYGLGSNANLIDSARREGCNIILSVYTNSVQSTQRFLYNHSIKANLIQRTIALLRKAKATGINIDFYGLDNTSRQEFVTFINSMYDAYQETPEHFKISITMPAGDKCVAYDITSLSQLTQFFIVDFSKRTNSPGALASLSDGSNTSVETCFSFYLSKGIAASKFILGVPYYGVEWQKNPKNFVRYISYNDIRNKYSDSIKMYKPGESAVYMGINADKPPINIWYDDDKTLGEKYDYAINNALGGVAIKYLGDDNKYGELEDELAYKLIKVDTVIISIAKNDLKTSFVNFLKQLTENPCDHAVNPAYSKILGIINICFIGVLIIIAVILFYHVKKNGDTWKFKKPITYILIGTLIIWSFMLLMWLFFWHENPFFGQSSSRCIGISFVTLFLILFAGTAVGLFSRWVYQLNRDSEKP